MQKLLRSYGLIFPVFSLSFYVGCGGSDNPPVAATTPAAATGGAAGASTGEPLAPLTPASKVDLLLAIDNSLDMGAKQKLLADSLPYLLDGLAHPPCVPPGQTAPWKPGPAEGACPEGTQRAFAPVTDVHVGVVSSSLGGHGAPGQYGTGFCEFDPQTTFGAGIAVNNPTMNDGGRLLSRKKTAPAGTSDGQYAEVPTTNGFLTWAPGAADPSELAANVADLVQGADEIGCGFEAQLESWYRFLVDPSPPKLLIKLDSCKFCPKPRFSGV